MLASPQHSKHRTKRALGLNKQQKLLTPQQFKLVYQNKQWGSSAHHQFNALVHSPEQTLQLPRLGITVANKVSKSAVERNRIKRQIREYFRQYQQDLKPFDLIITAKATCAGANKTERQDSLDQLWNKILKWQHWYFSQALHNNE